MALWLPWFCFLPTLSLAKELLVGNSANIFFYSFDASLRLTSTVLTFVK